MKKKIASIPDPRLTRERIDDDLQHKGHHVATEVPYCPGREFCLPVNHDSVGDEATPELDRVLAQEMREIKSLKFLKKFRAQQS